MSSQTSTMKWLLKREFWEHKGGFFWTPIVVSLIVTMITAFTILVGVTQGVKSTIVINGETVTNLAERFSPEQKATAVEHLASTYMVSAVPLLFVLSFTVFFYCLSALFDERKDRSVLFWKSLPVTDGATVLSKVATALCLAPLITLGLAIMLAIVNLIFLTIGAGAAGVNIAGELLGSTSLYMAPLQIAALFPIYVLWALPTVGWLLMVGAWARSKPFLWAVGAPLLAMGLIAWFNKMFSFGWQLEWFWLNIVGRGLLSLAPGSWFVLSGENIAVPGGMQESQMNSLVALSWAQLATPNLWIGVTVGAAMIYAAIRLRRWKDEG
jgi:ABC-2 type transport system permease protein